MRALSVLGYIMFGSNDEVMILLAALHMAGIWRILQKSGLQGWWSLFPGAREYQLSRCAGREPEGRIYSLITVGEAVLNVWLSGNKKKSCAVIDPKQISCAKLIHSVAQLF